VCVINYSIKSPRRRWWDSLIGLFKLKSRKVAAGIFVRFLHVGSFLRTASRLDLEDLEMFPCRRRTVAIAASSQCVACKHTHRESECAKNTEKERVPFEKGTRQIKLKLFWRQLGAGRRNKRLLVLERPVSLFPKDAAGLRYFRNKTGSCFKLVSAFSLKFCCWSNDSFKNLMEDFAEHN
jgi:hypothetical protein